MNETQSRTNNILSFDVNGYLKIMAQMMHEVELSLPSLFQQRPVNVT